MQRRSRTPAGPGVPRRPGAPPPPPQFARSVPTRAFERPDPTVAPPGCAPAPGASAAPGCALVLYGPPRPGWLSPLPRPGLGRRRVVPRQPPGCADLGLASPHPPPGTEGCASSLRTSSAGVSPEGRNWPNRTRKGEDSGSRGRINVVQKPEETFVVTAASSGPICLGPQAVVEPWLTGIPQQVLFFFSRHNVSDV